MQVRCLVLILGLGTAVMTASIRAEVAPEPSSATAASSTPESTPGTAVNATPPTTTPGVPPKKKKAPPPPEVLDAPENIEGQYTIVTGTGKTNILRLNADGVFEVEADGTIHNGVYRYNKKGWLSLDSGFVRRELQVLNDPAGMKVTRLKLDKIKADDPIGVLKPQNTEIEIWKRKDPGSAEAQPAQAEIPLPVIPVVAVQTPPVPKIETKPEPGSVDLGKSAQAVAVNPEKIVAVEGVKASVEPARVEASVATGVEIKPAVATENSVPVAVAVSPAPVVAPIEAKKAEPKVEAPVVAASLPEKASPTPPAPAAEKKAESTEAKPAPMAGAEFVGRYRFLPNSLVSETLVLRKDGAFIYKDSNGIAVAGYYQWKDRELVLTAGGVTRQLQATQSGKSLVLTRVEQDQPKKTGDLAFMSPCTRPSAQYEKIASE